MGMTAAASGIVSGGAKLASSIGQAGAASSASDFKANQYFTNAKLDQIQAQDAIDIGDKNVQLLQQHVAKVKGAQVASYAGQGVQVGVGSAKDVALDTQRAADADALTIRNNAWRKAWGFNFQSIQDETAGKFAQLEGKAKSTSTLLTGGMEAVGSFEKAGYDFYNSDAGQKFFGSGSGGGDFSYDNFVFGS